MVSSRRLRHYRRRVPLWLEAAAVAVMAYLAGFYVPELLSAWMAG